MKGWITTQLRRTPYLQIQLVSYLKQRIVAHKIPSSICQVSSVPLTAEMFVDQARIQKESNPTNSCKEGCIVQNIVMKAVCNVLEIDNVQPCHSFYSLGGHSLLTICLASKLSQELGVRVDVKTVFKAPSLNHLMKDVHLLLSSKNHESTLCSCSTAWRIIFPTLSSMLISHPAILLYCVT